MSRQNIDFKLIIEHESSRNSVWRKKARKLLEIEIDFPSFSNKISVSLFQKFSASVG